MSFPKIEFTETKWGKALRVDQPRSESLLEICEDHDAPVPFACRGASCSNCRVGVVEGSELLHPPNEIESEFLNAYKQPANVRLACCAKIKKGDGILRLESLGPLKK